MHACAGVGIASPPACSTILRHASDICQSPFVRTMRADCEAAGALTGTALTGRSALPPLADEQKRKELAGEQDRSGKGRDSGTSDHSTGSGGSMTSSGAEQAKRVQAALEAHAHVLVMHPITLKFQTLGGPLSLCRLWAWRLIWPS